MDEGSGMRRSGIFWGKKIEVVKDFKYHGFWFLTRHTGGRDLRNLMARAQKAANSV